VGSPQRACGGAGQTRSIAVPVGTPSEHNRGGRNFFEGKGSFAEGAGAKHRTRRGAPLSEAAEPRFFPQPMSEKVRPLRFGIMCGGETLQQFQARAVGRLIERGTGTPVVLVVDGRTGRSTGRASLRRRLTAPNLLWRVYAAASESPLQRAEPLDEGLAALPRIVCRPQTRGRFSEYFSDAEIAQIESYDLDFILRFGFGIVRGKVLQAAREGVWSFHHGDETRYRGGPPGFWEIAEGSAITGAVLQRLTERLDAGVILRRGWIKTIEYSYSRNLTAILNETIEWPAAAASEIVNGAAARDSAQSVTNARIYVRPSNARMLRYFLRLAVNMLRRLRDRERREEWNVGAARLSPGQVTSGTVVPQVDWFPSFSGGWIADPMARSVNGTVQVLCERMNLETEKGYIAAAGYDGRKWSGERPVIDAGCHASYPYIVERDGQTYCVPETHEANEVRVYRALDFPQAWEYAGTLLRGVSVVDSTIFHLDDLWWLLCTSKEGSGHRLNAYYSRDFFGPWTAHVANPVKTDVRCARPAGAPFRHAGALYRPVQDCSQTYGGRVAIARIDELTPLHFAEEIVGFVEPDPRGPFPNGLHTLSFAGEVAIVDGKRWRWRRSKR
jgi:hypothetical protein